MDRRGLGVIVLASGLLLASTGILGTLGAFRGLVPGQPAPSALPTGLAVATQQPSPSIEPLPTNLPSASTEPSPTPQPTADVDALVRAFLADLQLAIRAGDLGPFVDQLAPAVFGRYGRSACETELTSRVAAPTAAFEVITISPPGPWDYVTDEVSTTIPDAISVTARVTTPNASGDPVAETRDVHLELVDGEIRWFTDCGSPLK